MKTINKTSNKILSFLVNQAIENDGHIKISNDKTFMPVCVEVIDENDNYRFISVAHYYEQNSDLMADPEMCFIQYKAVTNLYHITTKWMLSVLIKKVSLLKMANRQNMHLVYKLSTQPLLICGLRISNFNKI